MTMPVAHADEKRPICAERMFMFRSVSPTDGTLLAEFTTHSASEVEERLANAVAAQKLWATKSTVERATKLRRAGVLLHERVGQLARIASLEMGKTIGEAEGEVLKCASCCEFYADHALEMLSPDTVISDATQSYVVLDPLGIVLAIMPWNYPFWQVVRFAAPALVAGNGVLLKHAENVPQCALAIELLFQDIGLPSGLLANIFVEPSEIEGILCDERIAAVTLTGSTRAGSSVASIAGREIKKQVLELGGSDPFILLADADLDVAVPAALRARFQNNGQSCIASKRFFIEESVAEQFVERFVESVKDLIVGDPLARCTQIGPIAKLSVRDELQHLVAASVAQGAVLRAGGGVLPGPGTFFSPTVLDHVTPVMSVFHTETFGPVASVVRVQDLNEAITLSNTSEYGLGATIWTQDIGLARKAARQLQSGAVFINGVVASDPRLPFGGVKKSGYGRELGIYGLREFTNIKTVWIGPKMAAEERAPTRDPTTLTATVLRPSEQPVADRGGGARTVPLVTPATGAKQLINGITYLDPGAQIPLHFHNCEESVVLLEGRAVAVVEGVEHELEPGDTTWIPANLPHFFRNPSTQHPMKILWTYASAEATRTLVSTGETRPIAAEHTRNEIRPR